MVRTAASVAIAVVISAGLVGCETRRATTEQDQMAERALGGPTVGTRPASARPVNTICPIGGHEFQPEGHDAALTRTHKGTVIGFCCDGCTSAWDSMAEAERDVVLGLAKANKSK